MHIIEIMELGVVINIQRMTRRMPEMGEDKTSERIELKELRSQSDRQIKYLYIEHQKLMQEYCQSDSETEVCIIAKQGRRTWMGVESENQQQ